MSQAARICRGKGGGRNHRNRIPTLFVRVGELGSRNFKAWDRSTSSHFFVEMNFSLNSMGEIREFKPLSLFFFFFGGGEKFFGNGQKFYNIFFN